MQANWLRPISLLSDFSDEELESLATVFQHEEFAPASILFREGETGNRFTLILRGEVEIIQALGTPDERMVASVGPGNFLGEMSLLDPSGRRSATARARDTVELAQVTQQDFHILLEKQPTLSIRLLQEMVQRLRRTEADTIRDLKAKNEALAQAYCDLQEAQAGLVQQEIIQHELDIARGIQKSILPAHIPEATGWQIACHWQPARTVSGDFYDILPFPDGRLGVIIADVSGKGVPASLVMATTCSTLRAIANSKTSPGEVLKQANEVLCLSMPQSMFVTCLYLNLDPASGVLQFANAGHNLPIKICDSGVQELRATGMPLGMLPGMSYEQKEAGLSPGDGLLLYTDGMVEAHNERHEMFGIPRLAEDLAKASRGSDVIECLLTSLAEFTGPDWEQEDDVTFVVLRREEQSSG